MLKILMRAFVTVTMLALIPVLSVFAQAESDGIARPGQLGFQQAATEVMARIQDFHTLLLWLTGLITLLVFFLLLWLIIRYNWRANPIPSKTTHNTILEILWTTVPIVILALVAVPGLRLLYFQDIVPESDLVIEVTGHQWSWSYNYPDYDNLRFDAIMLDEALFGTELTADQINERTRALVGLQEFMGASQAPEIYRLLDTDTRIVVPVGKVVKVLVTADDVLHAWAIPAFGIKIDAIPGRMNMTWFKADYTGTFYGQCSELCGLGHSYMPIVVEVVTQEEFEKWIDRNKAIYADARSDPEARLVSTKAEELTAEKSTAEKSTAQ